MARARVDFPLRPHTALLTLGGSRAYGMHTASSDLDAKGVAVPPRRYYLGFTRTFEQADHPADIAAFAPDLRPEERDLPLEGVVFELRKFVSLAAECNPNLLDVLFCRDEDVRLATPVGLRLREVRRAFLSLRARHSYAGYASGQLARIKLHWEWHHHGPEREPVRADFDLPETTLLPRDQLGAAEAAVREQLDRWDVGWNAVPEPERIDLQGRIARSLAEMGLATDEARWTAAARVVGLHDNVIEIARRERAYAAARAGWDRYQRWKRERNPARAALEAAHGYDTKHAAHLVRLLRMGAEILETGEVHVWRGDRDADELLAIRGGAWTYEQLLAWTEAQDAVLDRLAREGRHGLPAQPDREALDALCVDLVDRALR